jgi:D-threo-aldose 1-dehydrogenase
VNAAPFKMAFDYSYDGTMRSVEDSLQRMGLERMDICFIHDIDVFTRGADQPAVFEQAMDGCWRALSLRDEGVVKAIGVGVNEWEVCHAALQARDFDCFLLAGRYTLLEQEALDGFLPLCEARGGGRGRGGGFNSGILATGAPCRGAKYNYAPAPAHVMEKVAGSRPSAATTTCRCPPPRSSSCGASGGPLLHGGHADGGAARPEPRLVRSSDPGRVLGRPQGAGLLREDAPTP